MLLALGVIITVAAGLWLAWLGLSPPPRGFVRPFPVYGTIAWIALAVCEVLLALRVPAITSFFTALAWTFYIAGVDALVYRKRGDSMLHHPAAFTAMALLSIPSWLIFEAYNLWLRNWVYVGVPPGFWDFAVGACWAFATITPGILETADLILAGAAERWRCAPWRLRAPSAVAIGGAVCLVLPLLLPRAAAPYSFALVWAGFIFLLDPIQHACGWPSLIADLSEGYSGRFLALLLSGTVCGFLWEFWNFWASARWVYVFPILHRYRIFAMPFPGFVGFPPFAIECFGLYVVLAQLLLPPTLRLPNLTRTASPRRDSAATGE